MLFGKFGEEICGGLKQSIFQFFRAAFWELQLFCHHTMMSEELMEEILCRVPARSLKRLRSTCKEWNALSNDGRFTKRHCVKAAREFLVLISKRCRVYSMSINLSGMGPSIEVKGEVGLHDYDHSEIFHCDGLLLCRAKTSKYGDTLVVYNPCMGQTRFIKPTTLYDAFRDIYALGYEKNRFCCDNYKILKFPFDIFGVAGESEIYEFKSNSWRVLDCIITDWRLSMYRTKVSLKGDTYWIAEDRDTDTYWIAQDRDELVEFFLLKFDFNIERFQRLRLPFNCCCHSDTVVLSTVREEQLAVLYQKEFTIEIWLSDTIGDDETENVSWNMFFTVDLHKFISKHITDFMENKMDWFKYEFTPATSFMVDEENKVVVCYDSDSDMEDEDKKKTRIYIVGEDEFRKVELLLGDDENQSSIHCRAGLSSYIPSLVQI